MARSANVMHRAANDAIAASAAALQRYDRSPAGRAERHRREVQDLLAWKPDDA
jgi:hypothetical protein